MLPFYRPAPAPPGTLAQHELPKNSANPLSRALFHWLTPLMKIGYSRPLEQDGERLVSIDPGREESLMSDLWLLPDYLKTRPVSIEVFVLREATLISGCGQVGAKIQRSTAAIAKMAKISHRARLQLGENSRGPQRRRTRYRRPGRSPPFTHWQYPTRTRPRHTSDGTSRSCACIM